MFATLSGVPAWKRLICCSLSSDERISLITIIFSDRSETELVGRLSGKDAQSFVDVVDQVFSTVSFKVEHSITPARCWTA